ncbi:MAG: DNA polymerase Y family protein [Betaproteobacteria bacterium]|nr:DNA polymerase Y family protein [Betaproteobacteria bacterium]
MLWCSLLFPDLPLEVYARAWGNEDASRPFAVASGGSRPRIVAANDAARDAGVKRGQPVAGALALVPGLVLRDRDAEAEARSLEAIATFALSFTPAASLVPPRAVLAEIGGSLKLFGGLDRVVDAIGHGLRSRGHAPSIAVAPTPLAALVRARTRRRDPVRSPDALRAAIADVPLAALDLDARTLETLAAAGVRTIGAAESLPRDGLARRFGGDLVVALDRAHGRVPDPRAPWAPPPAYTGKLVLPAPAHDAAALGFAAHRLAQELAAWLGARGPACCAPSSCSRTNPGSARASDGPRRPSRSASPRPRARSAISPQCSPSGSRASSCPRRWKASRSRRARPLRSPAARWACCPATKATRRSCRSSTGCARGWATARSRASRRSPSIARSARNPNRFPPRSRPRSPRPRRSPTRRARCGSSPSPRRSACRSRARRGCCTTDPSASNRDGGTVATCVATTTSRRRPAAAAHGSSATTAAAPTTASGGCTAGSPDRRSAPQLTAQATGAPRTIARCPMPSIRIRRSRPTSSSTRSTRSACAATAG